MTQPSMTFAVIVLNWNGCDDTLACLASLDQQRYPHFQTIVVDNGSTDDSPAVIAERYPDVLLVENEANLGFAEGNNRGIRLALQRGFDAILLLNNDTTVDPDLLVHIEQAMRQQPSVGIFGPKIYYHSEPDRIWYAGASWEFHRAGFRHIGQGRTDGSDPQYDTPGPTAYACGCALAARSAVFRHVGLLDSRFFLLYEEADFCYRAKRAGYNCWFLPQAKVWHKISASFQDGEMGWQASYFASRNRLLWMQRNLGVRMGLKTSLAVLPRLLARDVQMVLARSTDPRQRRIAKARLLGVRDYVLGRFGPGSLAASTRRQAGMPVAQSG